MSRHDLYIAAHKAAGLCVSCASPAAPGHLRCERHLTYHRELRKRLVAEHAAAGLCSKCEQPVLERPKPEGGWRTYRLCEYHHEAQLLANRRSYRRKVMGVDKPNGL